MQLCLKHIMKQITENKIETYKHIDEFCKLILKDLTGKKEMMI